MSKTSLLLCSLLFLCQVAFAGSKIITGTVYDNASHEYLANANIQVLGTYSGTISNAHGKYILEVKSLPAQVKISYIGYFSQILTVTDDTPETQDIQLNPTVIEFAPIIVTDRDPAMDIMEQVIKKKQEWRKNLETMQHEAYFRMVFANDTSIACIAERVSDVFWDKDKGYREIIKSSQQTKNISNFPYMPAAGFMVNLYDDNIEIMDHNIMGPTHPNALKHYDFKLTGQSMLDDKIVFDIKVTPKSKMKSCFTGSIKVLDKDFAMIDTDLTPNESLQFPPPIQKISVTTRQQFARFGDNYWLPIDIRMNVALNVGITGLEFPTIKYNQLCRLTDYLINVPLPDSLYRKDQKFFTESTTVKHDTLLASNPIIVPLSDEEKLAYTEIKTSDRLEKSYKPTGLLARFGELEVGFSDGDSTHTVIGNDDSTQMSDSTHMGKKGTKHLLRLKFTPQLRYNRVEGLYAGAKLQQPIGKRMGLGVSAGYTTGLEKVSWGVETHYDLFKDPGTRLYAGYSDRTRQRYTSEIYAPWYTSIVTLLGQKDYFDYYRNKSAVLGISQKLKLFKGKLGLEFKQEKHSSLQMTSDYNIKGDKDIQPPNPAITPGTLRSVSATIDLGAPFSPLGLVGQKRLSLKMEHSNKNWLSSDFSFTSVQCNLDWRINTLFRRRMVPNTLDLRLTASTSTGTLPLQRYHAIDVSTGTINPFGTFATLRDRPLEGEKTLALYWEHNFRTIPFELLGLDWLTKRSTGLTIHGASGRTWIDDAASIPNLNYRNECIHEVGVSLDNLFNFVRLNATRRVDGTDWYFSIGLARVF